MGASVQNTHKFQDDGFVRVLLLQKQRDYAKIPMLSLNNVDY